MNNPTLDDAITEIKALQDSIDAPVRAKNIENNGGAEFANTVGRKKERKRLKAELRKKGEALPPLNPALEAPNRSSQGQRLSLKLRKKLLARKLAKT